MTELESRYHHEYPLYPPDSVFVDIKGSQGESFDGTLKELMTNSELRVIVVAALPGAGKSTIVGHLSKFMYEHKQPDHGQIWRIKYDDALKAIEDKYQVPSNYWELIEQIAADRRANIPILEFNTSFESLIAKSEKKYKKNFHKKPHVFRDLTDIWTTGVTLHAPVQYNVLRWMIEHDYPGTEECKQLLDSEDILPREQVMRLLYGATMRKFGKSPYPEDRGAQQKSPPRKTPLVIVEMPTFGVEERGRLALKWFLQSFTEPELIVLPFIPHPEVQKIAGIVRSTVAVLKPQEVVHWLRMFRFEPNPKFKDFSKKDGAMIQENFRKSAQQDEIRTILKDEFARAHNFYMDNIKMLWPYMRHINFPELSNHELVVKLAMQAMQDLFDVGLPVDQLRGPFMNYPHRSGSTINLFIDRKRTLKKKEIRKLSGD